MPPCYESGRLIDHILSRRQYFYACLSSEELSDTSDFQRAITRLLEDKLRIEFTLAVRVATSAYATSYYVNLLPVSLGPVDMITSKLRDQDDELNKLRAELAVVQESVVRKDAELHQLRVDLTQLQAAGASSSDLSFAMLAPTKATFEDQTILWKRDEEQQCGAEFFELLQSGTLHFTRSAILDVFVTITHNNNRTDHCVLELLKNGKRISRCFDASPNNSRQTTTVRRIVVVSVNDEITALYKGNQNSHISSTLGLHVLAFT